MRKTIGTVIGVVIVGLLIFTGYTLLSMDESWNDINDTDNTVQSDDNKDVANTENYLQKVEQTMTVEIETATDGSIYATAKDSNGNAFKYYGKLEGDAKTIATAIGAKEGDMAFSKDNESESYLVDSNIVIITYTDATAEQLQEHMNTVLDSMGLTLNDVKYALREKYESSK
ncbi:MAG: hypothetical protein ACK5LC_11640 [Coprobacillaceae bacterium]